MPIFQEHWGLPLPAHAACSFTVRSYHGGRYNNQLCNDLFLKKMRSEESNCVNDVNIESLVYFCVNFFPATAKSSS